MRRDDARPKAVAIGFVHQRRLQGNRIRIGAFTEMQDIDGIMTPTSAIISFRIGIFAKFAGIFLTLSHGDKLSIVDLVP